MNGLDELRGTLDRHAAEVVDHHLGARVGSVRQRVRRVRRRRRAAVVAGTALAVVVALGTTLLTRGTEDVEPAPPPRLAGLEVPRTMESLGYTFAYAHGETGEGVAAVELEAGTRARLVSWGKQGTDDRVTVTGLDGAPEPFDAPDFTEFTLVPPGFETVVSARGEGEFALAVYELTDDPPAGVTAGGVTFRDDVAGDRLLAARVGAPGQAEVSVSASASGTVSYRYFCAGAPDEARLHLELADGEVATGACDEGVPFDPGNGSGISLEAPGPGEVGGRLWVSAGVGGALLSDERVVVGLGIYAAAPEVAEVAGFPVRELVEFDGRLWRRAQVVASEPGDRDVEVEGREVGPPQLAVGHGLGEEVAGLLVRHGDPVRSPFVHEYGAPLGRLWSGDTASVRHLTEEVPPDARLVLALYERVD